MRKKEGCRLDEKVVVYLPSLPDQNKLLEMIKEKTLAKKIIRGQKLAIKRI